MASGHTLWHTMLTLISLLDRLWTIIEWLYCIRLLLCIYCIPVYGFGVSYYHYI